MLASIDGGTRPVDHLKMDGVFVCNFLDDPMDCDIIEPINRVGHALGVKTIAEPFETRAVRATPAARGMDGAQGSGSHRPEPLAGRPATATRPA